CEGRLPKDTEIKSATFVTLSGPSRSLQSLWCWRSYCIKQMIPYYA
ncbi:MAG: hypothetical protein AVDCRST_MAG93-4953, partial [uncultured Chloroflexia bacterium]